MRKKDITMCLVMFLLDMRIRLYPKHYYKIKEWPRNGQVMVAYLLVATLFKKRTVTGVSMMKLPMYVW